MFFRKSTIERLPITMSGVRMGERLLQIGIDDAAIAGRMSAKVGLSGHAAIVVENERSAARARSAAAVAGVLVEVQIAPLATLPFGDAAFDVVVVNGVSGWVSTVDPGTRAALLAETLRVLRSGGRLVVIEAGPRRGLPGWLQPAQVDGAYERGVGSPKALAAAGFRAARVLGEREGYRFVEGLKG